MQYNFCTLFDRNYLYKGLALEQSFHRHCTNGKFWILCMDDCSYETLGKLNLQNTELIALNSIEDKELLSVKADRNPGEYSWTCKPYLILYILNKYPQIERLTYLDSDLYFFKSPEAAYREFGANNIMLTPHRFPEDKKHWVPSKGKYNAGTIFVRRSKTSLECLEWWREKCIDWCFHRLDNGRLGDQMYLDHWQELFPGVHDTESCGINLGPWSLSQYKIQKSANDVTISGTPLILYHYHALNVSSGDCITFEESPYPLSAEAKNLIYAPYSNEIKHNIKWVQEIDSTFNYGFIRKQL